MFDIYTIIVFLALAVFIFLRLRSVLGQRTGRERPPYGPYSPRGAVRSRATDKVVTLPSRPAEAPPRPAEASQPPGERWKDIAESGSAVAAGLDAIATADPSFDAKHFITGARTAYEMIVTTFAEGDRRQLRSLLSREAYLTPFFQCRLFGDTPYLAARARRRGGRMIDRSKRPSSIVRPKAEYRLNEIAEAPPSRRQRVGLIAQRASPTRIRREQG